MRKNLKNKGWLLENRMEKHLSGEWAAIRMERKGAVRFWASLLKGSHSVKNAYSCVTGQLWKPKSGWMAHWPDVTPLVAPKGDLEIWERIEWVQRIPFPTTISCFDLVFLKHSLPNILSDYPSGTLLWHYMWCVFSKNKDEFINES